MSREELSQIYYINKEITMWENELNALREKSLMRSKEITGMPFANTNETSDPTASIAIRIRDIELIIVGKRTELLIQQERITKFIMDIEDSYIRQIIKYRCVDCMKWQDIADKLHTTENAAKQMFSRFLKNQ